MEEAIHQTSYVPDCKEEDESHPHFIFRYKLFLKPSYISKLVNLNYFFKASLKAVITGTTSQFHNGIHLKILFIFIWVFLRHITYCQRKPSYEDEYDNRNKRSNFEWNLASHINKIRKTSIELGWRDLFQDLDFSPKQQW